MVADLSGYFNAPALNTTTTATTTVGTEAQLMLLQVLTQVKLLQDICKPSNESSPGEEALRAFAREAIEREQDMKRQLDTLESSMNHTVANLTTELQEMDQRLNATQQHNKDLQLSLKEKEDKLQELQRKLDAIQNVRIKQLQDVLNGQSPEEALIKAAKRGDITVMTVILDTSVDMEYSDVFQQWTALEWAVAFGHTQACRLLLERGANPRKTYVHRAFKTTVNHWPLRLAARFGHLDIASLLLQYGADIPNSSAANADYSIDVYNNEPETIARARGFLELAQMLCEWRNEETCHYLSEKIC